MKKVLSISLLAVYLIFSSGIHLEIDKCCGRIASLLGMDLEEPSDSCCTAHTCCIPSDEDKEEHNGCDLVDINLFIQSDQKVPTSISVPDLVDIETFKVKTYSTDLFIPEITEKKFYKNSDPPDEIPIYIFQNSLVLYG